MGNLNIHEGPRNVLPSVLMTTDSFQRISQQAPGVIAPWVWWRYGVGVGREAVRRSTDRPRERRSQRDGDESEDICT